MAITFLRPINYNQDGGQGGGAGEGQTSPGTEQQQNNPEVIVPDEDILTDDKLTEDHKNLLDFFKDKYEGAKFDKDNNLVSKDKKRILTLDQINALIEEENAKTQKAPDKEKTEGTKDKETNNKQNLIEELAKTYGLPQETDLKQFTEDGEGLVKLTNYLADYKMKQELDKIYKTYPELEEFKQHLELGGSKYDFVRDEKDYNKIEFNSNSEIDMMQYIIEREMKLGKSAEEAKELALLIKGTGTFKEKAKSALDWLKVNQTEEEKEYKEMQQQQLQQQKENYEKMIAEVNDLVVKKGNIGGIVVPELEKQKFVDYVLKPADEQGNPQYVIDNQKRSLEDNLKLILLSYYNLDFNKLVTSKKESEITKEIFKKLQSPPRQGGQKGGNSGFKNIVDVLKGNV